MAAHRTTSLPKPGDYLKGLHPVKFPHTAIGAVATAAAMYQYLYTIDPAAAQRVVDVYVAAENQQTVRRDAAQGAVWFRQKMGLPESGQVPPEATVAVQPIGVQWQTRDADNVYASLNLKLDMVPGDGAPLLTAPAVITVHMQWRPEVRGGDWVAVQTPPDQMPAPKSAEIGTPAFDEQGWLAIRPAG
ncbi:hypothetical protein ACOZ38_24845 [Sphaerisporangium viridialbum]|uniref:hypothetical protein n=1 Tax=Sphaerisporangium viridialbum TaxID=46189 RepID=UPI003C775222